MRANLAWAAALTILLCAGHAFAGQDGDGVPDFLDNCIDVENLDQADADADGHGDACECGDVSGDGFVNTTDARLIQRCAVGQIPCGALCDVSGDGLCNTTDARLIQRLAVGQLSKSDLSCRARPPESPCEAGPAGVVRESSAFEPPRLDAALRGRIAALRESDADASFSFFHCHVDGFATAPKETIPDYAAPILRELGLPLEPQKPERIPPPVRDDKYTQDLDSPESISRKIPLPEEDPLPPVAGDENEEDIVRDDPGSGAEPIVETRRERALVLEPRDDSWEPPDAEQVRLEARAARPILAAFLNRNAELFELPRDPATGAPRLEMLEDQDFGVGRFFRRAVYRQRIDGTRLLGGKTVVLFDANWNVIQISRMLATPEKLGLPEIRSVVTQEAAQDVARRTVADLTGADPAVFDVASAEAFVDAVRRTLVWEVHLVSPEPPLFDFRVLIDAPTGDVLNVSDELLMYTDAKVRRWAYTSGDLTKPFQVVSTGIYTRDDNTLRHDFFYTVTDNRGSSSDNTCSETRENTRWRKNAYNTTGGSQFIRHTHRSDRDFSIWSPAASSGSFQEGHSYYWSRLYMLWNRQALKELGAISGNVPSESKRLQIIHNACIDDIGYANSSLDITAQHNEGETNYKVRLREGCRSGNPNCDSGDYGDSRRGSFVTCEGSGCEPTPSVIHHELNHYVMGRLFGIGSGVDCGSANQLKFLHEGTLGSVVPHAYWHHYYGIGFNPPTDRLFTGSAVRGRVHADAGSRLTLGSYLCVNNDGGGQQPYEAGRVAGQPMWELYFGKEVVGNSVENTLRPATDTDFLIFTYWAADLVSGSTYRDRYELANRWMQIAILYANASAAQKAILKDDWCNIWSHHGLGTYINSAYCD